MQASGYSRRSNTRRIALFWDESFLWGLIAYHTFTRLGVDFDLVTSEEIRQGCLDSYAVVFVPGGWASNKIKALGETGKERIRSFIDGGGGYLGFCGGAGMALSHDDGLGLTPVTRKPTSIRVPSFSGKIELTHGTPGHPIWNGISDGSAFYAWWPGQFSLNGSSEHISLLACYGSPQEGSYVADLLINPSIDWAMWEKSYGTNLNPDRIKGEPAVIETRYGAGKVLLSYLHFETPGDDLGHRVLINMLGYLTEGGVPAQVDNPIWEPTSFQVETRAPQAQDDVALARELESAALDLISFGEQNFLWYWRNPWILQWRRGVRGIEYCTLYTLLRELAELIARAERADDDLVDALSHVRELALPFVDEAKELLLLERYAMNYGPLSPLKSDDERIRQTRKTLFSNSKRFGGRYKEILDAIDAILLPLLKAANGQR